MDDRLTKDFVKNSLKNSSDVLRVECEQLNVRLAELEKLHEEKISELERLRRAVKMQQALKLSALAKSALLDGEPTTSCSSPSLPSTQKTVSSTNHQMLELNFVSAERQQLLAHKKIVEDGEHQLNEKKIKIGELGNIILRLTKETDDAKAMVEQLRCKQST